MPTRAASRPSERGWAGVVGAVCVVATALAFTLYSRVAWPWFLLGWVALVPWLVALDRRHSLRMALASGVAMAVAFELTLFGWFVQATAAYTGVPWSVAALVVAIGAPLLQPQFVAFAVARHLARRAAPETRAVPALVGAGVYVGTEWAVPKLFADTVGHGVYASLWMRQAADVVGVAGLTFSLVLVNECVLALGTAARAGGGRTVLGRLRAPAACLAAIFATLLGYGAVRLRVLASATAGGEAISAGIVQANISHYDDLRAEVGVYEAVRRIVDWHVALSTELLGRTGVDLLVWPETVYPTTFGTPKSEDGAAFDREIATFVARTGVPLVFGAYDVAADTEFNAAVLLEPPARDPAAAGAPARRHTPGPAGPLAFTTHRKAALFPLTERVPALLDSALVRAWMPWLGTWSPGPGATVMPLALPSGRTVRVAPLICYDALAPQIVHAAVRRGAEVFVTISNDSWFAFGQGPHLHHVVAAFKSIETRRPQIRATTTGVSAVITATGDVLAMAGVDERATLAATVLPDGATTTLLVRWGEWFAPTALVVSLGLLATVRARGSKRGRDRQVADVSSARR